MKMIKPYIGTAVVVVVTIAVFRVLQNFLPASIKGSIGQYLP